MLEAAQGGAEAALGAVRMTLEPPGFLVGPPEPR
jgi:hypothetical protein